MAAVDTKLEDTGKNAEPAMVANFRSGLGTRFLIGSGMTPADHSNLAKEAYALTEEIRDGKWTHFAGIKKRPASTCQELVEELEQRCRGHSKVDYSHAIARGLFESR